MKSITRVGIDTAKDWLDVFIDRPRSKRRRFRNDAEGIAQLKADLGEGDYVIGIEATGRYEALARHELESAGYTVRVKNPRQMRRLAEGLGYQAKTDCIDAQVISQAAELGRQNKPRSKEREGLGDLSRTIECLKKDRSNHLKRMKAPGFSERAIQCLKAVVKAIDEQIAKLEKEFIQLVKKSSLARRYELALSVRGVGPALARIAVCEMPEDLHAWSARQLCAYAGVAAIDDRSGNDAPPAKVPLHSNRHLKGGLYMPAISLVATQDWAKRSYARLLAKGRTHQQAMIAIMHKLMFHLIAVLKRGSPWQAEPPKRALTQNHTI